jgi:Lrp/AsnC family leucine-responsive transcriptional regulator
MNDNIDVQIMNILQNNSRTSNVEIARKLQKAPTVILDRIRKLEERKIISGYEARLNPIELDLSMLVFVFVRTDEKVGQVDVAHIIAKVPEVLEVHHVAGEDCYLIKLRVKDTQHLSRVMREQFGQINQIQSTRTTIVFETIKETSKLPLMNQPEESIVQPKRTKR